MKQDITNNTGTFAVYLPFKTTRAAIQNLRVHGLPPKIERTAFDSRSGQEQTQLLSAFKFLGFTDDDQRTQPTLRKLVDTKEDSPEERAIWAELLKQQYAKVFELDLKTATMGLLEEAIGTYRVRGATRRRAVRFFIKAAQHAQIDLSSRLTKELRETSTSSSDDSSNDSDKDDAPVKQNGTKTRRRRRPSVVTPAATPSDSSDSGKAMKTVQLPAAGGTLTISGTFNPFDLDGAERTLVYEIIDKMKEFEAKARKGEGNATTNDE